MSDHSTTARTLSTSFRLTTGLMLLSCTAAISTAQDGRLFDTPFVGFDASDLNSARCSYASWVADFDHDGDPDVAVASRPDIPRVTVLDNLGNGMHGEPQIYTLPKPAYEIIRADLDGDGFVDSGRPAWARRSGDRMFVSARYSSAGGLAPGAVHNLRAARRGVGPDGTPGCERRDLIPRPWLSRGA